MAKKWVYLLDEVDQAEAYVGGEWDHVRGLLGGKGANLSEMVRIDIPVPLPQKPAILILLQAKPFLKE
jgi:pyruvate,orthophosphate dikinase